MILGLEVYVVVGIVRVVYAVIFLFYENCSHLQVYFFFLDLQGIGV